MTPRTRSRMGDGAICGARQVTAMGLVRRLEFVACAGELTCLRCREAVLRAERAGRVAARAVQS